MLPSPTSAAAPKPAETIAPGELNRWVAKFLNRRILMCLLGSIGCALAAAVVLWLSWWAIYFTIWFSLLSFSTPTTYVAIATWVCWALLFVAYFTANRPELERLEFEAPSKLRAARITAILTDSPYLALTGPKTVGSFVKVVSVVVLVGPGMLATSWKLLLMALAGLRGSPEKVAQVLQTLATVGVRLPLEELMRSDSTETLAPTFAAVRLFDGVIVRTSEPVGLALTDRLRDEILQRVPPDQRRATAAKSPPVRVSSPAKPGGAAPSRPAATLAPKPKTASPTKPSVAPPPKPMKPTSETPPRRPKPPPR